MIRVIAVVSLIVLTVGAGLGQPAATTPAFEVANVKPNRSGRNGWDSDSQNGRLTAHNGSLRTYIQLAYQVKDYQVSGPSWIDSERYDIVAKAPEAAPESELMRMLQTLLSTSFRLEFHRETREFPVYALVVAKNGPKLKEAAPDSDDKSNGTRGRLNDRGASMSTLANQLARRVDRPVVDRTGLQSRYDFTLVWDPNADKEVANPGGAAPAGGIAGGVEGVSIFAALAQQLGLKLEPQRGPMEVLVVDHAEKVPVEN